MNKKIKTGAFIVLLLLAAVLTVTAARPQRSAAYFTAYTTISGNRPLNFTHRDKIEEEPSLEKKVLTLTNGSEVDAYFRVKVFAGAQIDVSKYSGDGWILNNADGYIYYGKPVAPGEETSNLTIFIDRPEDFKDSFNVVVAEESVPALYDEKGEPYADWEAKVIDE